MRTFAVTQASWRTWRLAAAIGKWRRASLGAEALCAKAAGLRSQR